MTAVTVRFARAEDAGLLLEFIRQLAAYERAPQEVVATEEDLRRQGFGGEPRFEALLAFLDGREAGFALFVPSFSTWLGRPGIYLEDLFVSEWARRRGVGRRLVARLASVAVARGCARLDLAVLDWNPARGFYDRLGFEDRPTWLLRRAAGETLARLAAADRE